MQNDIAELLLKLDSVKWHSCISVRDMKGWLDQYYARKPEVLKLLEEAKHGKETQETVVPAAPTPAAEARNSDD